MDCHLTQNMNCHPTQWVFHLFLSKIWGTWQQQSSNTNWITWTVTFWNNNDASQDIKKIFQIYNHKLKPMDTISSSETIIKCVFLELKPKILKKKSQRWGLRVEHTIPSGEEPAAEGKVDDETQGRGRRPRWWWSSVLCSCFVNGNRKRTENERQSNGRRPTVRAGGGRRSAVSGGAAAGGRNV